MSLEAYYRKWSLYWATMKGHIQGVICSTEENIRDLRANHKSTAKAQAKLDALKEVQARMAEIEADPRLNS